MQARTHVTTLSRCLEVLALDKFPILLKPILIPTIEVKNMDAKQKITVEQAAAGFDQGVAVLDQLRAIQIAESLRLESAKGSVYARENTRLLRKYGKDHPRTTEIASRIKANEEYKTAIVLEYTNASTVRPDPGAGWAVDGFVRTAKGAALKGVTIAAYDDQGKWYRELGYACTDQAGYFSLVKDKLPEELPRPVFMRASQGKQLLPSSIPQLSPKPGTTDRVEIIIGEQVGETVDCVPPDGNKPSVITPPEPQAPGNGTGDTQRYAGNPATRELHDTQKLTKRCNFDAIKPNVRVYFDNTVVAEKAGYDYCAYCFGKAKSKR